MVDDSGQQAIRWMIALQDNPDDESVVRDFMAWLRQSDANRQAWVALELSRSMALAAQEANEKIIDYHGKIAARKTPILSTSTPALQRKKQKFALTVAAALAAIIVLYVSAPSLWLMLLADYRTAPGQVAILTLPDQSVVQLGGGSAVAVNFSSHERSVRLLVGEAYFEVQKDMKARPFVVSSDTLHARAAGTTFEVLRRSSGASVSVREGQVIVGTRGVTAQQTVALKAGEEIIEDDTGTLSQKRPVKGAKIGAWRDGVLYVEDWPFSDVIDVLERYYSGTIIRAVWQLDHLRVTGVFSLKQPVDTLRLIAAANGLRVRNLGAGIKVLSSY